MNDNTARVIGYAIECVAKVAVLAALVGGFLILVGSVDLSNKKDCKVQEIEK